jgi:hypothetical protein
VAGTPTSYSFDPETKRFEAVFSTTMPDGRRARRRLSEIYVPRLHYGRDYRVEVKGGKIVRGRGTQRIELRARRRAKSVTVTVTER